MINDKSKSKPENKVQRWKRKMKSVTESNSKKAKLDYGQNACDVESDIPAEEQNKRMTQYIEKTLNITDTEIRKIEEQPKEQSQSKVWKH